MVIRRDSPESRIQEVPCVRETKLIVRSEVVEGISEGEANIQLSLGPTLRELARPKAEGVA